MGNQKESNLDPLENLEENFANNQESEGYRTGLELGKRDGQKEGYSLGFNEGAKRGAELGYFKGYTMTYKHLISGQEQQSKTMKKLNDILELIDEFPRTNETNCEEKLSTLRAKFKQAFASTTLPSIKESSRLSMNDKGS